MINWNVRYSQILNSEADLYSATSSILEIGPGNMGLANFINKKITGLQPSFNNGHHTNLDPVIGSAEALPFADDSFDYSLCIDVLEHIPDQVRPKVLSEMLRVTRKSAWITFPTGLFARTTEFSLNESLHRLKIASPDWLEEHLNIGLPEISKIIESLNSMNCNIDLFVNESVIEHFSGLFADLFLPNFQLLLKHKSKKIKSLNPFTKDPLDVPYSIGIKLSKKADQPHVNYSTNERFATNTIEGVNIYLGSHVHIPSKPLLQTPNLTPIYLGDASNSARRSGLISDILSDGTSLQNSRWCELSGIYKIWREGPPTSHIGFCHYRRVFNFSKLQNSINCLENFSNFDREQSISSQSLEDIIDHIAPKLEYFNHINDIVVPPPIKVPNNIFTHYAAEHVGEDILEIISIIVNKHPTFKETAANSLAHEHIYCNNMFVMKSDLFDKLCSFWFAVLFEFERNNPKPKSSVNNQGRDIAFLSERVFDIWIKQKIKEGISVHHAPIYNISFPEILSEEWSPTKFK